MQQLDDLYGHAGSLLDMIKRRVSTTDGWSFEIWYGLFRAGRAGATEEWLSRVAEDEVEFDSTVGRLVDYCFFETHIQVGSYSIHSCVHDTGSSTA